MENKLPIFNAAEFITKRSKETLLGRGGYGQVRLCKRLQTSEKCAVKYFSVTGSQEQINEKLEKIMNEGDILHKLSHPNIIKVFGITKWKKYVGIVTEYLPGGNLDGLLHNRNLQDIPWTLRLRMVLQISKAINYLHRYKSKKELIHGDIKAENILLDKNLIIKLADFGSVNIVRHTGASATTSSLSTNKQHTLYYTAPEFLKDPTKSRTTKMDIYSFGIVLYEFVTRSRPYNNVQTHLDILLQVIVDREQRPDQSHLDEIQSKLSSDDLSIFKLLVEQMKKCWSQQPSDRPELQTVCESLRVKLDEIDEHRNEQHSRNIIDILIGRERDFDSSQGIPLNLLLVDFDDAIDLDESSESTKSQHLQTNETKEELLQKIKTNPSGRDLIKLCGIVLHCSDEDFISQAVLNFPTAAWILDTPLSSNDANALSCVLKKMNRKMEWLDLARCNLNSDSFKFIIEGIKEMETSIDILVLLENYLSSDDIDGICSILHKLNVDLLMQSCFEDGYGGMRHANNSERKKIQNALNSLQHSNLKVHVDNATPLEKDSTNQNLKVDVGAVGASLPKNSLTKNCEIF